MTRRKMTRPNTVTRYCKKYNLDDYTDDELKCLQGIFLTYKQRGGYLGWARFTMIPLKHNPGNLDEESGDWTKYIRELLSTQGRELLK